MKPPSPADPDSPDPDSPDPDSPDPAAATTRPGIRGRRTLLTCGAMLTAVLVTGGLLVWLVIAPRYRVEVDPDLGGPVIRHAGQSSPQNEPERRGSITDHLIRKRETPPAHPLDPALEVARQGLEKIRGEIRDYTALMVKQERVNGKLLPEEFMRIKVRHADPERSIDRAFYVRHVKPQGLAGQEAIWIENRNGGKLIGHGPGIQRLIKVNLDPDSWLAMRNNRYPITELGIETLIVRMIEKGHRDREHGDCEVTFDRDLEIDQHQGTLITITHPVQREPFEFHVAKIYIDDELDLPVGYEGYGWPETPGGEPVLLERYFYRELNLNAGLTDADFDPQNPDYDYP